MVTHLWGPMFDPHQCAGTKYVFLFIQRLGYLISRHTGVLVSLKIANSKDWCTDQMKSYCSFLSADFTVHVDYLGIRETNACTHHRHTPTQQHRALGLSRTSKF